LNNWDRTTINLPFGRGRLVGGETIVVPPDADAETMEKLRAQLEATLNEATRLAYAQGRPSGNARSSGAGGGAEQVGHGMANSLPMTLRVYQQLSAALVPLAPALIKRRLKQGKEDPARIGERRGMSRDTRPHGPLVWIHGASVGEVLAAAALIEKLRALNIRILLTSGTVTSAAIVAKRFPADIIHQYVPYDSPRFVARFLDHWRPSLALFIESDLWPNLILVERGAAAADGADQRPDVASLVPALAPGQPARFRRCLAGSRSAWRSRRSMPSVSPRSAAATS
jgi:hypothetical protein